MPKTKPTVKRESLRELRFRVSLLEVGVYGLCHRFGLSNEKAEALCDHAKKIAQSLVNA